MNIFEGLGNVYLSFAIVGLAVAVLVLAETIKRNNISKKVR